MRKLFLLIFSFIFTVNSSEYIFSIWNMYGEPINILFSPNCNLQYSGSCCQNATFFQLNSRSFQINMVNKIFFKLEKNARRDSEYYFSIENYPGMRIQLIRNWWNIRTVFDTEEICVIYMREDVETRNCFVIAKYTEDMDEPVGVQYELSRIVLNYHPIKNMCNIQ